MKSLHNFLVNNHVQNTTDVIKKNFFTDINNFKEDGYCVYKLSEKQVYIYKVHSLTKKDNGWVDLDLVYAINWCNDKGTVSISNGTLIKDTDTLLDPTDEVIQYVSAFEQYYKTHPNEVKKAKDDYLYIHVDDYKKYF